MVSHEDNDCQEVIKVQISFAKDADLANVESQLIELASHKNYEFYCCFLPRDIVEEQGFGTQIVDLLDKTLGDRLTYQVSTYKYPTAKGDSKFQAAMLWMSEIRDITANKVDKLYVLDSKSALGVAEEIKLFTKGRVNLI